MSLPKFITDDQSLNMLQTKWAAQLDPALANILLSGSLLKSVQLSIGANIINHSLNRKLQGWFCTRRRAAGTLYDTQDANTYPNLTLLLTASGAEVVDIYVY